MKLMTRLELPLEWEERVLELELELLLLVV
jgi:hypothetical protein